MARFVSVFISEARQRLIAVLVWFATLTIALFGLGWFGLAVVRDQIRSELEGPMDRFIQVRQHVVTAFDLLERNVTAPPCTPEFFKQLHRVAYRPDGLSEYLHAPGGVARCAVHGRFFEPPVPLGEPDMVFRHPVETRLWLDRPMAFIGLDGKTGSMVSRGDFTVVVPTPDDAQGVPSWMTLETVAIGPDGRSWHRSGARGLYDGYQRDLAAGVGPISTGAVREIACDPLGLHCIVGETTLSRVLARGQALVVLAVLFAALLAGWVAWFVGCLLRRYWSFEARFRRYLGPDSIVCAYQPLMDLASGRITGCEVLVRWRDVNDAIVSPNQFLPIVEKRRLTMTLTRLVIERAAAELSAALPSDRRLQVNINIFPCDLDAARLLACLAPFDGLRDRLSPAVEIVENSAVDPAQAHLEVEKLRRAGVKTYIDDFGSGYSTIQGIADMAVDGVKLDRAFALAPPDSLMGRMLGRAIEMVQTAGRQVVVEGVETAERLAQLRAMPHPVDVVQGYHVGRPMPVSEFADFLAMKDDQVADRARGQAAA